MISKAQQKRDKDLRIALTRKLNFRLKDFKDRYIGDYTEYQESVIKRNIEHYLSLANDPKKLAEYNDEKREQHRGRRFSDFNSEYMLKQARLQEGKLVHSNLNKLTWMNEANDGYTKKLDSMIQKLVEFRLDLWKMNVELIEGEVSDKFSFLISDDTKEVHARVIYACGTIKAPHYRFIITKRNK